VNTQNFSIKVNQELKAKGHRKSKVRDEMLRVLEAKDAPLTAAELIAELTDKGLAPNKSTVYREIETLLANHYLQRVTLQDEQQRYCIAADGHHHHLVCLNCGKIVGVDMDKDLDALEAKLEQQANFKIQEHTLEFYGLCQDCK
jgi:Fur family ferric uptake transcriptional regulator